MPHTILSVDDDVALRGARDEVLREAGFEVIEAVTGTDALQLAAERQPALVVLAIALSGMDGFAVARRLKSDPRTASIPLLHISSRSERGDYPESLKSGVEAYWQLPVEPAALIATVTALIQANSDGSERKRAEAVLREREEKLRLTLDAAGIGTFEYYLATGECFWDREAKAVWGLPPDAEIAYPQLIERIHPEDRTRIRESLEKGARTESQELSAAEYRVIWPDGEVHWILGASRTFFEGEAEQRHATRMIGFHRDVTESKRAEAALRASEGRLRLFVEHAPAAIAMLDRQMRYVAVSRRWMVDYALGEQEPIGRSHYDVFPEISERWKEIHRRCLAGAVEKCEEDPFPRANGDLDWIRWEIHPWRDGNGEIGGIIIFSEQITARKRAEEALRASEQRYRTLFETMAEGFALCEIICDAAGKPRDYRHLALNPAFERHTGLQAADVLGPTLLELFPDAEPVWIERYGKVALTGEPARFEAYFGPQERWYQVGAFQTEPGRFGVVFTDITERKLTEEALRESEAVLRTFFDSPGMMRGIEELIDGRIVHVSCNQAAAERLGVDRESIAGKSVTEAGTPEEAVPVWAGLFEESRRTGKPVSREYARRFADGEERWMLVTASYLGTGRSGFPRFGYTCLDLTDRKRAEEALRESEQRFRALVMASSDVVYRMSPDWSEMRHLSGRDFIADTEKPSRTWLQQYIHPDDQSRVMAAIGEAIRAKKTFELEHRVLRVDGTLGWTFSRAVPLRDANGETVEWLGAATDITERKHAEERLREAQKLESLGLLAGGVAHDFNNLLVGVIGNASLAQEMLSPDHPAIELLDGVIKTGQQAAHLTRQMLAYAGKGKFVVEALNLSALIPEMAALVRTSISKKIALDLDLEQGLPTIQADRGQIQQVFMNLVLNAADAIGSEEGLITVKTGVQDVNERYLQLHPEAATLSPGKHVRLEVRDTGCGMDDATRARIFDPFFSTKFTGRGLGLAAVAGILRGHKGAIMVSSAPGRGSRFTVLFAAAESPAGERPVAARDAVRQGAGVVLVVDDEKLVREMVRTALQRYGYTVLLAESGLAAIDLLKRHPGEIGLIMLDLSMPGMSGEEALPALRRIRPEVKVLVSSGYSESETMTLFEGQPVSGFIQKPYTGAGLAEKVKACLG
jgi:PAS domain S-box-containing protein